jgi:phage gp36-like protein
MLLSSKQGNLKTAKEIFSEVYKSFDKEEYRRILRYNYAVILYDVGSFSEAAEEAYKLAMEYYEVLNLSPEDVFATNVEEVLAKITDIAEQQDDLKHLADSLDLYAKACNAQGKNSGLARLHAHKFYVVANAVQSAVRVGQDVVDEQLSLLHDADAARHFMEDALLPVIQAYKLFDYLVPVRAQYAVVLAYCGEMDKANAQMRSLAPFIDALPDDRQKEFENQRQLIQKISRGAVRLGPKLPMPKVLKNTNVVTRNKRKIGRNEPCPCGSGKKYKKCCGRYNL